MTTLKKAIAILSLSALLSACGSEETSESTVTDTSNRVTISGSAGDVVGATVTLRNTNGVVLETTTSDPQANYSVTIEAESSDFPITLEATNGIDLVTGTIQDFTLLSTVVNSASTHANLNPHSTFITKIAQLMSDGLSEANLAVAKQAVTSKLNFGLDADIVSDPITNTVDSSNAVVINHSSEALAELVRRASTELGSGVLENDLISALAADLTDGLLDGKGTAGVNPQYTAVTHAVSLQVLLESMLGNLHVNDIPAEAAISTAIDTILGGTSTTANRSSLFMLNYLMFRQAISALSGIQAIDPSVTLRDLMQVLRDLDDGASKEEMAAALEQYSLDLSISSSLDSTIDETVTATEEEVTAINDAANAPEVMENMPPVISGSPPASVTEGANYSFTPSAADPDGNTLTFTSANLPVWASFNTSNGMLTGTPGYSDAGTYSNIVISVSDGSASASLSPFAITVQDTNRVPSISGTPALSVAEGSAYVFTPTAADPDGDAISFTATNVPAWASFNTSNGTLAGTPDLNDAGVYSNIVISVRGGTASAMLDAFSITVTNTDETPTPTPVAGAPSLNSANLSGTSVVLVWTQNNAVPEGGYDIILDGVDTNTQYRTTLLTATIPGMDTSVSHCFAIQARYTDTSQFFTSNELCTNATAPTNNIPTISGNPSSSVAEGATYSFTPSASDPDGDSLTFSISAPPTWASFNTANGTLSGTPGYDDAGVYNNIVISVSDGSASASLGAFSINVGGTNQSPSISGTASTSVAEGASYSFTPSASDPDGDSLTFSISAPPTWASFNTANGTLSGTPGYGDAGDYNNIVISVSDGAATASLSAFSINVANTNRVPTISGSPANSVTEGEFYTFTPNVADDDGDNLTFSVVNLPGWASFNSATGTLEGTAVTGVYNNIGISVSDDVTSTALGEFSISVNEIPAANLTDIASYAIDMGDSALTLSPAAFLNTGTNVEHSSNLAINSTYHFKISVYGADGTMLSNFSSEVIGYHVYLGTTSADLNHAFDLTDGLDGSYWISDLMTGTYYLSISAYNTNGEESRLSGIAEIQVL